MTLDAMVSAREWILRCLRLLKPGFLWMTYRPLYHVFDQALLYGFRTMPVVFGRSDIKSLRDLMLKMVGTGLGFHEKSMLSHRWIRMMALGAEARGKARSLYMEVALAAFERANEHGPVYVDCLVDLVVALEALYLAETDELSYRLANRVASLLGHNASERVTIQQHVRNFYRDRNYVIHGAAKALAPKYSVVQLREYVRRSLLYHVACASVGKDRIVEMLDKSLFEVRSARSLREKVVGFYGAKLTSSLGL